MANCLLATPTLSHAHFLARLETRASELSAAAGGQNSDRHASDILLGKGRSRHYTPLRGSVLHHLTLSGKMLSHSSFQLGGHGLSDQDTSELCLARREAVAQLSQARYSSCRHAWARPRRPRQRVPRDRLRVHCPTGLELAARQLPHPGCRPAGAAPPPSQHSTTLCTRPAPQTSHHLPIIASCE